MKKTLTVILFLLGVLIVAACAPSTADQAAAGQEQDSRTVTVFRPPT